MRVEIMGGGGCGKVGGAEVCSSMFNLYEYFHYLDLDLGSYISIFDPLKGHRALGLQNYEKCRDARVSQLQTDGMRIFVMCSTDRLAVR
jgi:hypothetical protein